MGCSIDLSLTNLILLGVVIFAAKKAHKLYKQWKLEKMLEKWNNTPRDKLIMHTMWRCKALPNISPYGLKLETYLRMTKIPYEMDTEDPFGPKGKIPWITLNGTHVADSHFCIEFLRKKYNVDLNGKNTLENLAKARACRIMLEDGFSWGLAQYRWVENIKSLPRLCKWPEIVKLMLPIIGRDVKKRMEANGIGLHSPTEIYQITGDNLRAVSEMLGSKKFICGDEPCEDDAAIFGMLSQAVWGAPGSSFEKLAHGELDNLKQYCVRMKDLYWPDWEACLDRK